MAMDSADDLEYAEGVAKSLAAELRRLRGKPGINVQAHILTMADDYCRPTCQAEGSDDPDDCLDGGDYEDDACNGTCACPCHSGGV